MYYQYFGLTEAPFSIAVNPRYLFMSARHRDALAHLLYGVGAGGGFILLTGEVGTGKTTINRCLLAQLPTDTDVAIILNPALNAIELLASACDELQIKYDHERHTLKTLTDNLHSFLLKNHARGRKTVLLIDEAQHLDFDVLEQIRLLTNLETNSEKLLQIILIGQPELAQMLALPELRQLNQRITARFNLDPLNVDETGAYIHHRLQVAGMNPERVIFPPSVVRGIYKASRGIPRVINVLCDRMLLGAYGRNKSSVDHAMLNLATQEVLGGHPVTTPMWRWFGVAAVVLLSIWAGGWLLGKYTTGGSVVGASGVQAITEQFMPAAVDSPEPTPLVEAESAPELTQNVPAMAPAVLVTDTAAESVEPVAPVTVDSIMQPSGRAMAMLWALYSVEPPPAILCSNTAQSGVACLEGEAWTWDELNTFDRPLLLEMITAERFSAEILLLGMDEPLAWVLTDSGVASVSLAELAPFWTGRYQLLWHPPAGFSKPLALGDDSAVVATVAQLFAQLDAQPSPLADQYFNGALQQRVRLFQQENELIPDGVVGIQTLLKLNEQLGIDLTAAQARKQLQRVSGSN
jgi:general secretion pathway protein A